MTWRNSFPAERERAARAGFTLVELLVAAAITVLIAGLLIGVVATTLTNWNRTQGILTSENQARAALDWLERDLQGACFRSDGNAWLVATVQTDASVSGVWVNGVKPVASSLNPAAPNLADARFGLAGVWLRFFTRPQITGSGDPAGPVAVSYQIVRRSPTPAGSAGGYLLYRAEVTAPAALTSGYDLTAADYTVASDPVGEAGNLVRPGFTQVLADNVIDFGVRFYAYLPDAVSGVPTVRQIFPADASGLEYRAQSPARPGEPPSPFPAVIDVFLRVLNEDGARQLAALEAGRISGDWWTIATAHSRVFVRRIRPRCAPS
jgi:type II secretory pathway pseudopilin PulG